MNKGLIGLTHLAVQIIRVGSKPGCTSEIYHMLLDTPIDECAEQGCRRNGWNQNTTEYVTITCGESERSFNQALLQYGSGKNFSISWIYASEVCHYPLAIEAIAVNSCEDAEQYECQDQRTKKCLYIQPHSDAPAIPEANAPLKSPVGQAPSGGGTSSVEQTVLGFGVTGWILVVLLILLIVFRLQKKDRETASGYAPLAQTEENVFTFFDIERPKEQKPVVPANAVPAPVNKIIKPQIVQEEKSSMLRIPATELNMDNKKKLGSGQASEVFEGTWRQKRVAVKIPRDSDASTKVIKELTVLMELEPHPNIVEVYGYFELDKKICVVLELCNGSSTYYLSIASFLTRIRSRKICNELKRRITQQY